MSALLLSVLMAASGHAAALFGPAKEVAFDQRVGASLPLDAPMRAEDGSATTLRAAFQGRPALLVPIYFRCPMLCPLSLEGLVKALRVIPLQPGKDFDVVVFSFDPRDTAAEAAKRRAELAAGYKRGGGMAGFRVLTGPASSIKRLTDAIGFRFAPDKASGEFAHAPGAVVVTPDGKLSQYFLGIDYPAQQLRLALVSASAGKIGTWRDQVLLCCFHYDEFLAKHTAAVLRGLKVFAALTVLVLVGWLATEFRRESVA